MYRFHLLLLLVFLVAFEVSAQLVKTVASLPEQLRENSGLAWHSPGKLYFINDGGNPTEVYLYDTLTGGLQSQFIGGVTNIDWEDLATDDNGNLFIGDIGNNGNNRRDLKIYKLKRNTMFQGVAVGAELITYTYENQTDYPPPANSLNFDCEAMLWFNDSIYLFTKNRTSPYDGWCYMYSLPDQPGDYVAKLRDSVQFPSGSMEVGWITAADIKGDSLILLSSAQVHLVSGFQTKVLSGLSWESINVGFSQKEAMCFGRDHKTIYLSDEFNFIGNKLYKLLLGQSSNFIQDFYSETGISYSVSSSEFHLNLNKSVKGKLAISDINGRSFVQAPFSTSMTLSGNDLPNQVYIVQLEADGWYQEFRWAKTR